MRDLAIFQKAERNAEGDLIVKERLKVGVNTWNDKEVNVSALFAPGKRKSHNVKHLVIEARIADEQGPLENPAFPTDSDTADAALEQIEAEGLEPAWLSGPYNGDYP